MSEDIADAEARAELAKRRLGATLGELQMRLDPRMVARDAVDGIAETGRRHPAKIAGAAALIAAFLGRKRIGALIGKIRRTDPPAPQPAPRQRVRSPTTRRTPADQVSRRTDR